MTSVIETVWSVGWLTGVAALLAAIPRLGRLEVVSRLAVVGISLLSAEEPRLSFWSRALIRTQRDRWPGGSGHSAGAGACICSFRFGHRGSFRMVPRRGPPGEMSPGPRPALLWSDPLCWQPTYTVPSE